VGGARAATDDASRRACVASGTAGGPPVSPTGTVPTDGPTGTEASVVGCLLLLRLSGRSVKACAGGLSGLSASPACVTVVATTTLAAAVVVAVAREAGVVVVVYAVVVSETFVS
jgi:hypothetical protein